MTSDARHVRGPEAMGRFVVRRPLGRGGFGVVWEVRDPLRPGLRLALKVLSESHMSHREARSSVTREFRLASQVRHPVVLEFLEGGLLEHLPSGRLRPYLLSEFARGSPLRPPWEPRALVPVAKDLLSALDAIHAAGWRHGDLQPRNILVAGKDGRAGRPEVRLLDFGLAEEFGGGGAKRPTAGTPRYLAPEVLRGARPDHRTDFYALGLILYECLCGAVPRKLADHLLQTRQGVFFEEVCRAGLPDIWSRTLRRLLDPDPDSRIGSGAEGLTLLEGDPGGGTVASSLPAFEAARPVGQRRIFEALGSAFDGAGRPRPGLVVVEGGTGQGKSRLVREAEASAFVAGIASYGWDALRHAAYGGSGPGAAESGKEDAWHRRVFLASGRGASPREDEAEAAERLAAAIVDRISSQRTMITVDDFDRLPPTERLAVRLIVEKVRNLRQRPRLPEGRSAPLVLLTVSPGIQRRPEYARWWGRLSTLPWTAWFSLQPWTPEEVSEYLDRALPPRRRLGEVETALRRNGNPGRLRLLLKDLASRGDLRLESGAWVCRRPPHRGLPPLPGDRELFQRDWSLVDGATRNLLGVSAVWSVTPMGVPFEVLAAALNTPLPEIATLLRRTETLEFLKPQVVGRGVESRSLVLKRTQRLWIARAAGPAGRRRWRRLLTESTDSAIPLGERVVQELRLGPVVLPRVLAATREGGSTLESILRRHANDPRYSPADRAETAHRLGEILHARGEFRRAERYLVSARVLAQHDEARARIDSLLGEAAIFRGKPAEAEKVFERLLRVVPREDPSRWRLLCDAAICKVHVGKLAEALNAAEGALNEYPRELTLQNLVGVIAMALGHEERAEGVLRSALRQSADSARPGIHATLCTNYGLALRLRGDVEAAAMLHRQAAAEFERDGLRSQAARAYGNLGVGLRRLGQFEAAVEAATRSLELHREVGDEQGVAVADANLGILARELGLYGTARRRFRAAESAAGDATSLGRRVQDHPAVLENRLLLALELGDERELEELLSRRRELPVAEGRELLAETLLLELRLWRSGKQSDPTRLLELIRGREFTERDVAFLAELATLRTRESGCGDRGALDELERWRKEARRELSHLSSLSSRAMFYRRLVELEESHQEAERDRASRYLKSAVQTFPVREARSRALKALARRAPDRKTREKARAGLRRLVDEILFDLEPGRREAYRRRVQSEEVLELTHRTDSTEPALKRARQVVQDVLRFNEGILEETQLEGLLRKIVDAAMALTDAERGVLVMREHGQLKILAARMGGQDLPEPEGQISHTLLERALEEGVARLTTDAREDLTLRSVASVEELGLRSVLCVPLRAKRPRVFGALYLDNPFERAVFDADDLSLAETFCSQAALAWAAAERRRQTASLLRQLRRANRELNRELCLSRRDLARRLRRSRKQLEGLVGDTTRMREVFHLIEVVAPTEIPVLITGESGTGKELVARAIHRLSHRSSRSFVAENCGAVPASLLESALFGHVRGAFTGADRDCPGIFQMADGGTLFLDEIAEMPAELQARLLRVLQEGEVRPLGARRTVKVDVRVVAATNRDVRRAMESGKFREDLYYRLQGAEIHVPALRDNADDVPLLAEHFLETLAGDAPVKKVSLETMELLGHYSWPGNVRELENEIRRLVLLCPTEIIGPQYLSPSIRQAPRREPYSPEDRKLRPLREVEQRAILDAMERLQGHRVKVAEALGISRSTLYLKLREMGYGSD